MLRLGALRCGRCDAVTPVTNWGVTNAAAVALAFLVVVITLAVMLSA